ncbi:molecular chaperone TorD [Vibrio diazotrophicus]|uniref:molecular chaperone TorD n=1 Tax=Vibrio diazotrophicus TaxID=685 RepID=UPI00142E8E50|nr:molecular chaperone TorD [Vibrio diazotrophicus]NIY93346.1 molecular chaperone TorD [Vibrio diazotrophicus]
MKEIKAFNEKRAEIYWWLSGLFANELTEQEVARYDSPEIHNFLAGLGENAHLADASQKFISVLNRLLKQQDAQVQIANSFYHLFSKCDENSALPYASLYFDKSKCVDETPEQAIALLMEQNGVHVQKQPDESYDHLSIELDFLGHLIIRSNELEKEPHMEKALQFQAQYIRNHLLSWVPEFSFHCSSVDKLGFYSSISVLLVAFLELDLHYLTGN